MAREKALAHRPTGDRGRRFHERRDADVGEGSLDRFGYNLKEKRWAYGTEPPNDPMVAAYLKEVTLGSEEKIRGEHISTLTKGDDSGG